MLNTKDNKNYNNSNEDNFSIASIFTNNMVLQRNKKIPVWGFAKNGLKVIATFCGQSKECTAHNGKWRVDFEPVQAGGPFELKIISDKKGLILENILVGDVWIAGGQSNMEQPLLFTKEGKDEIPNAYYDKIRFYTVPRRPFEEAQIDGWHFESVFSSDTKWLMCTPESASHFSAVGFEFAKDLYNSINVPVGIVSCNWGATSASAWMNEDYLNNDEQLKIYMDEYEENAKLFSHEEYEIEFSKYLSELKRYATDMQKIELNPYKVEEYLTYHGADPFPVSPIGLKNFRRPAGLYHTMLEKIVPYAAKGVIWYQGESDIYHRNIYKKLFSKMIENWRNDFEDRNLPFVFVQLTSFGAENPKGEEWAILREQQMNTWNSVDNTAMVVSIDYGEENNIHPTNKKIIGQRLSLAARANFYQQEISWLGPRFNNLQIVDNMAIVTFNNEADGLAFTGDELRGFQICGEDRIFEDAIAEIKNGYVEVHNQNIISPLAVRYGWTNFTKANLYNSNELPALPFRTDDF